MASYVSVVWTTGDVLTEAKLDNMVANDQSETAHSANGMIMNNNVAYRAKQAGGTTKDVMKLNTDDLLTLSQINEQDGQSSVTNTVRENQVIQRGWGYVTGGGSGTADKVITLADAYDDALFDVNITTLGAKTTAGTPSTRLDAHTAFAGAIGYVLQGTHATTGFTVRVQLASGNITSGDFILFSWIAIGTMA